jgi:predicted metalloprotease with PDZ domain
MGGAPGEGVWFAHGFSRHVARVVLFRLGLLTDDEMVAELDSLDSVLATSALAGLGNVEVVQHGTPEAVRLVTARGALYAARLESVIATHTRGNRTLEGALASLVRRAIHTGPELSLVQWEELIADCAGAEEVQAFRSMVLEGRPVDVPSDAMGPCFRSTRGRHVPFELGFVDTGFTGEPIAAHDVDPLGPAHAAGLRSGDTIVELRYRLGDPSVEVVAVIERDGDRLELGWAPRGAAVPGRRWIRDRRVPDVACVQ